jgi:hypothetical protein
MAAEKPEPDTRGKSPAMTAKMQNQPYAIASALPGHGVM